jgi:hypothetical protein
VGADGAERGWPPAAEIVAVPALVGFAAAAALWVLARVPPWLDPCPHLEPGRWASLALAEKRLGMEIWIPRELPAGIAWPPHRIACLAERPIAVRLVMTFPGTREAALELTQAVGPGSLPLPPAAGAGPTEDTAVAVNGMGTLRVTRGPAGGLWRQVTWIRDGRRLVLAGPLETAELLRIARSVGPAPGTRRGP